MASVLAGRVKGANELLDMQLINWSGLRVGEMLPSEELENARAG